MTALSNYSKHKWFTVINRINSSYLIQIICNHQIFNNSHLFTQLYGFLSDNNPKTIVASSNSLIQLYGINYSYQILISKRIYFKQVPILQVRVDLRVIARKRYSTLTKSPGLIPPHYQMQFRIIPKRSIWQPRWEHWSELVSVYNIKTRLYLKFNKFSFPSGSDTCTVCIQRWRTPRTIFQAQPFGMGLLKTDVLAKGFLHPCKSFSTSSSFTEGGSQYILLLKTDWN